MHFAHLILRNPKLMSTMWVLLLMLLYFLEYVEIYCHHGLGCRYCYAMITS